MYVQFVSEQNDHQVYLDLCAHNLLAGLNAQSVLCSCFVCVIKRYVSFIGSRGLLRRYFILLEYCTLEDVQRRNSAGDTYISVVVNVSVALMI